MLSASEQIPPASSRIAARGVGVFQVILLGEFISMAGSGLTRFALGVWVFQVTGSPTRFALNALAATLPYVLVSPFAGALVDRWSRKWLLVASNAGSALSVLALALFLYAGRLEVWHVYVATAVSAFFAAFQVPAFMASTPMLVDGRDLGKANAWTQAAAGLAQILAPALAGALIATIQVAGVLVLDFMSFLVGLAVFLAVRIPDPDRPASTRADGGSLLRSTAEGWRHLVAQRGLLHLMALFAGVNFLTGIVLALSTPLVLSAFRPAALGAVLTIGGVGALIGSLSMAWFGRPGRRALRALVFTALCGACIALCGVRPSVPLMACAAFGGFFAIEVVNGCTMVIFQSKVAAGLQGRIVSISSLLAGSTLPLAYVVAGPLAESVFEPLLGVDGPLAGSIGHVIGTGPGRGIGLLFILAGGLTVVAVGVAALSVRLRRLDLELPDAISHEDCGADAGLFDGTGGVEREPVERGGGAPRGGGALICLVATLAVGLCVGLLELQPPDVAPQSAAPGEFSAERAMAHLAVIAQEPHPVGSRAHAEVRDYLVGQLEALGLSVDVERRQCMVREAPDVTTLSDVENVVAKLPGVANSGAVLLVAHYDSVPTGPGASDDGAAVAAILETVRAVASGPPPNNDLVVLFTDGEEQELLGAQAFVDEHPWASGVGVVFNFEARGTSGQSLMFETSDDAGGLVREFGRAVRHPATNSLFREAYKLMPNDTDFTVFRKAGYLGLNFAYIGDPAHYHSELDSLDTIDPRSLQHQGETMLDLARAFGAVDLARVRENDAVYFTVAGRVVRYPAAWVLPVAGAVVVLFVGVVAVGVRRGMLGWRGMAGGAMTFAAVGLAAMGSTALVWLVLGAIRVANGQSPWSDLYHADRYVVGFAFASSAVAVALVARAARRIAVYDLWVGALVWWGLLAVATSLTLPGASYLFVWPLVASLLGFGATLFVAKDQDRTAGELVVASVSALPGLLLLVPLSRLLFVGLSLDFAWVLVVLYAFAFGLLTPHVARLGRWSRPVAATLALVGIGCVLWGYADSSYDARRKCPDSVFYAMNVDTGAAVWATTEDAPDEWTAQFFVDGAGVRAFDDFFPGSGFEFLQSNAPAVPVEPSTAEVLEDSSRDGVRTVRLHLRSPQWSALVQVAVVRVGLVSFEVGDRPLDLSLGDAAWFQMRYWAFPENGIDVTIRTESPGPLVLRTTDFAYGLPDLDALGYARRGEDRMAMPFGFGLSDRTLVTKTFNF